MKNLRLGCIIMLFFSIALTACTKVKTDEPTSLEPTGDVLTELKSAVETQAEATQTTTTVPLTKAPPKTTAAPSYPKADFHGITFGMTLKEIEAKEGRKEVYEDKHRKLYFTNTYTGIDYSDSNTQIEALFSFGYNGKIEEFGYFVEEKKNADFEKAKNFYRKLYGNEVKVLANKDHFQDTDTYCWRVENGYMYMFQYYGSGDFCVSFEEKNFFETEHEYLYKRYLSAKNKK